MTLISRKCIVTNEVKPVSEMMRVVRTKEKEYLVNSNEPGRGAYFTNRKEAFDIIEKKKLLNRAFRTVVPNDVYNKLKKEFYKED